HYGSLSKALHSVSKFKLPLIIEPRFKNEIHDEDLSRRFNSDFVVIDPVDKTRNAAAGVSHESLGRFVIVARQFVKKPSIDLFYRNRFSSTKVRGLLSKFLTNSGLDTFLIESKLPDKSEDITFPQLRKMGRLIVDHLERNGFSVYLSMPVTNGRRGIILLMAPKQILKSRMLKGPNVFVEDASHRFMEKHKGAMGFTVVDLVLYALEKSKYQDIKSVLRDLPSRLRSHKDINLSNAKVLVNKMPKELAVDVYAEILKKTTI
ncbi:MAG: hypothetical protein KGH62_03890, partial [Candidatus Micrarchaeota archaeon]|nr:hypothetical protein [Candidatus Micrarchaeota archaeon]